VAFGGAGGGEQDGAKATQDQTGWPLHDHPGREGPRAAVVHPEQRRHLLGSTGTEGIKFSLSDSDLVDLITNRGKGRIILEENPGAEEPDSTPKRKRQSRG
jgi:hypothetical protein